MAGEFSTRRGQSHARIQPQRAQNYL